MAYLFSLGEISTKPSHQSNSDDGEHGPSTSTNATKNDECHDNNVVMQDGIGDVG